MTESGSPNAALYDRITPFIVSVTLVVVSTFVAVRVRRSLLLRRRRIMEVLQDNSVQHKFPLIEKVRITDNTYVFRFGLPTPEHTLGLPIGKHVIVSAELNNPLTGEGPPKLVARPYTPITSDYSSKGYFELLVKIYRKSVNPRFPEGGWMSQHLESLSVGDSVAFKGPYGRIQYLEKGMFKIGRESIIAAKTVGMIAGGTGITPMYQILQHVFYIHRGKDLTKFSLLYGNLQPKDILLRDQLEEMAKLHSEQFNLALTVDKLNEEEHTNPWTGFTGFVNLDMIKQTMPAPGPNTIILICGPPAMVKSVEASLLQLGHAQDRIIVY